MDEDKNLSFLKTVHTVTILIGFFIGVLSFFSSFGIGMVMSNADTDWVGTPYQADV